MDDSMKTKCYKSPDGTVRYIFNGKLHNWDGPALVPKGNKKQAEYYLNGIQHSEREWKLRLRDREGLPWYKAAGNNVRF